MNTTKIALVAQASALVVTLAMTATPAAAQSEVEELVVTARKRDEALIDLFGPDGEELT